MEASSLSTKQALALNRLMLNTGAKLLFANIGILFLLVAIYIGLSTVFPGMSSLTHNGLMLLAGLFLLEFVSMALMSVLFLEKAIQKPAKNFQLILTEKLVSFSPYKWKWFFIVLGIHIAAGVIAVITNLPSNSGLGIGVTLAAFYIATYYIVTRMIKSGEATFEPVN